MAVKTIELTESQHLGWDKFSDDRAVLEAREARYLAACLRELGGKLSDPWQWDRTHRVFYLNTPDATADPTNARTDLAG